MKIASMMILAASAVAQDCKASWGNWAGSWAYSFGQDPNKPTDYLTVAKVSKSDWVIWGSASGVNKMKQKGKKLHHFTGVTGSLVKNGDIKWSHGYTSRLWEKCPPEPTECQSSWDSLNGVEGRSWATWDITRKTVETLKITSKNNKRVCISGSLSKRNCFKVRGNRLVPRKKNLRWLSGKMQPNGDIKWSHGYTSRPNSSSCAKCKLTIDNFLNRPLQVFSVFNPTQPMFEVELYRQGDSICGEVNGEKGCVTDNGEGRFQNQKDKKWTFVEPEGRLYNIADAAEVRTKGGHPCEEYNPEEKEEEDSGNGGLFPGGGDDDEEEGDDEEEDDYGMEDFDDY